MHTQEKVGLYAGVALSVILFPHRKDFFSIIWHAILVLVMIQ